eukprot:366238-Chlamydomonas_euryale.AAC.16
MCAAPLTATASAWTASASSCRPDTQRRGSLNQLRRYNTIVSCKPACRVITSAALHVSHC